MKATKIRRSSPIGAEVQPDGGVHGGSSHDIFYRMEFNRGYEARGEVWTPGCFRFMEFAEGYPGIFPERDSRPPPGPVGASVLRVFRLPPICGFVPGSELTGLGIASLAGNTILRYQDSEV